MALTNLGLVPNVAGVPTLSLSPAQVIAEGSGAGGMLSYTLTLTRRGFADAVPFTWSVTGAGANQASASDFADGLFPTGSGTFAPGETSRTLTVTLAGDATPEANEGFAIGVTAALPLVAASAGTIVNDDSAAPAPLLMGSRYNQMGYGGATGSNGTDTDSNSRIGSYNETGTSVTAVRGYFANWFANTANEQDGYNAITVSAAVEYPAGTFTPLTFAGATSVAIPATGANLGESDEAVLATAIPAGALYWVRTFVSVAAGQKWPQGYVIATAGLGEAADFATGVSRVSGGTITNATPTGSRRGYGPVAVKATAFGGVPVAKAFAAVGDSIVMGLNDSVDDAATGHGNIGYFAKACAGQYPVVNMGFTGTKAVDNLPANFTRRAALLGKIGITHILCDWAINDLNVSRTASQLAGNVASIAAGFRSAIAGVKVVWTTTTPYTMSTDAWKTVANQTVRTTPSGAFTGGAGSQRGQFNALLRAGISGVDAVFDAADAAETARDSGVWRAGEGAGHLTATGAASDAFTSDGLHPTTFSTTAPVLGGIYVLRDAARAVLAGW